MLSGTANNPIYPRAHQSDTKDSDQADGERKGRENGIAGLKH
jgi:hypothetical protein